MRRTWTMTAAALLAGSLGVGAARAQSTATPDTGSTLGGISTGRGEGEAGSGQGQSGTTDQRRGGPANLGKPAAGRGGDTASRPPTGRKERPSTGETAPGEPQRQY